MGHKRGQKVSIITYLIHMVCKRLAENTSHYEYIYSQVLEEARSQVAAYFQNLLSSVWVLTNNPVSLRYDISIGGCINTEHDPRASLCQEEHVVYGTVAKNNPVLACLFLSFY